MSGGGSDSNTNNATQALTTSAVTGMQHGSYFNGPQNGTQINNALGSAQNLFQNGTPTTQAGLDAINVGAQGAGDLYTGAQPQMAKTIAGDYTSAGNPQFQGMVGQLANSIRPQIDSGFEANGRGGSGANDNAFASALTNEAGSLAYSNYGAERGIQNADMTNLPSYTAGMFQPGQAQLTAGYTPINQFINQLKSVSPGTAGSMDNNSTTNSTTNSNTTGSGNTSGFSASSKK